MRWDDAPAEDEPLGRPFLTGGAGGSPGAELGGAAPPGAAPAPTSAPDGGLFEAPPAQQPEVRPYLLTGGRTRALGACLGLETVVLASGLPLSRGPDAAGLERAGILRLAERPCSAAEVAARLHLPLQVALVLVTDLVAEGLLDATAVGAGQADDVLFLERLIAGVAAL